MNFTHEEMILLYRFVKKENCYLISTEAVSKKKSLIKKLENYLIKFAIEGPERGQAQEDEQE